MECVWLKAGNLFHRLDEPFEMVVIKGIHRYILGRKIIKNHFSTQGIHDIRK